MDRTAEFQSLIVKPQTKEEATVEKQKFYEGIYSDLQAIQYRATKLAGYKALLALEKELSVLVQKSTTLLDNMSIAGEGDVQMHFEGVKHIINRKIVETLKCINIKKSKTNNLEIELEPQRPVEFKKVAENQMLEQDSKSIVESVQYEATKQRLLKIEAVQKAIHENLLLQDERIDNICISQSSTGDLYCKLNSDTAMTKGSFFKRMAFTIIMCLIFVLIFVHIYYR